MPKHAELTLADATILEPDADGPDLERGHDGVRFIDGDCTIEGDLELDRPALVLRSCGLETIPESLFEVPDRRFLAVDYNRRLPESELERVRDRWPGIVLNALGRTPDVWLYDPDTFMFWRDEGPPSGRSFHYAGLEVPEDAEVSCWARGSRRGGYHPWFLAQPALRGNEGSIPLDSVLSKARADQNLKVGLRLSPGPSRRRPHVERIWID